MGLILFALFLGIPIAEIALFVLIGERIGVLATIAIVIATAIAGAALVRRQGFNTLERARLDMEQNRIPAGAMAEGLAILFAGALLLTPGFLTDTIGFALLIPPLRARIVGWVGGWLAGRMTVVDLNAGVGPGGRPGGGAPRYGPRADDVIDGEAVEIDDEPGPDGKSIGRPGSGGGDASPWRQ